MAQKGNLDIDEVTGWSQSVVQLVAKAIQLARRNPKSWAVLEVDSELHINVGQRNICEIGSGEVVLLIDNDELRRQGRHPGSECTVLAWRDNNTEKFSSLRKIAFSAMDAEKIVKKYRSSHLFAVQRVREKASPFRAEHRNDLLQELVRISGVQLPPPK